MHSRRLGFLGHQLYWGCIPSGGYEHDAPELRESPFTPRWPVLDVFIPSGTA